MHYEGFYAVPCLKKKICAYFSIDRETGAHNSARIKCGPQTALPTECRHVTHLFVLQFDTSILLALLLQWGASQSDSSGWCPEGPRRRKISLGCGSHLTPFILCCVLFLFPILLYFNDSLLVTLKGLITRKDMKQWWIWQGSKNRQRASDFE